MKKILIFLTVLIFTFTMFVSCEKKTNLPWDDHVSQGVIATLKLADDSDTKIYKGGLDTMELKFDVGVPFGGDFSKLNLMVAIKLSTEDEYDYENQYVLAQYSSPGIYSINSEDLVNGVSIYNDISDIQANDKYRFFMNVLLEDGRILYTFLPVNGEGGIYGYDANTRANPDFKFFKYMKVRN